MKIIAFMASQRRRQYTEKMLQACLEGFGEDIEVTRFYTRSLRIEPCRACGACSHTGECIIQDEMHQVYDAIAEADAMVVASPVYFNGVPAPLKVVIDRTQRYWAAKYDLGQKGPGNAKRPAYLLSCGGAPFSLRQFTGMEENLEYFFAACNFTQKGAFYISNTDSGELSEEHPVLEEIKAWAAKQTESGPSRIQRSI